MPGNNQHKSCPSSTASAGATLLGTVKQDGTVSFVQHRMVLDEAAATAFQRLGNPENQFRFSSPCAQNGCGQWTGSKCGVIQEVLNTLSDADLPPNAPACIIRPTCRWFYQEGVQACYACSFVITDLTIPATETVQ